MRPNEQDVLNCLTSEGKIPLDYCFLLYECVCSWEPVQGEVYLHRIEDNQLFAACKDYLRVREASLSSPTTGDETDLETRIRTLDALARYAEVHKWPNLEALKKWLDSWRKYFENSESSS